VLLFRKNAELTGESAPKKPKVEKVATEKAKNENDKAKKDTDRQRPDKKESGRGRNTLTPLSEPLMEFLGTDESEMDQHEVTKALWDYIAANRLQVRQCFTYKATYLITFLG
jgi:chromatin remodeling complex protein RSC6